MRRLAVLLLIMLAVVMSFGSTMAQSKTAIRPGQACPTLGAEVTQGGRTFTCALRNGKKVWVRKRTPVVTPTWQQVASELARNAVTRRTTLPNTAMDFRGSPSLSTESVSTARELIERSYGMWQRVAPIDNFPVLLADENSKEWYLEQSSSFPSDGCGTHWWNRVNPEPSTQTGAVCWAPRQEWGYMALILGSRSPVPRASLGAHEAVHVAQWSLLGVQAMNRMECWFGEGMAELYAGSLSFLDERGHLEASLVSAYRKNAVSNLRRLSPSPEDLSSAGYWLDVITKSEDRSQPLCWDAALGYSLGYLVTERLVADFGEAKLFDWMRLTRASQDSDSAFTSVYGISQDAWYAQSAAPYVASEATALLG